MKLFIDTETFGSVDLRSVGVYRYAESAELLIVTYAFDDGGVMAWDVTLGNPMPHDLRVALDDPSVTVVGHNFAGFDRHILRHTLGIDIPVERIIDTAAQARSHSLPGSLAALCDVFKLPADQAKDVTGKRLIGRFCKPQPENRKIRRCTSETHPEDWGRFIDYAKSDILALRKVYKLMPKVNYPYLEQERELFALDQKINDRGFRIDTKLAIAASNTLREQIEKLNKEMQFLTGDVVTTTSQVEALKRYLADAHEVHVDSLDKEAVGLALARKDLPTKARRLLEIRQQAASTTGVKFHRLLETANQDHRLRGTMMYCGAARTGRWSGRLFQPQNLSRPSRKAKEVERGIDIIKAGAADLFESDVIGLVSDTIRGVIVASPQSKLCVADLSNIEGRIVAWLAGEDYKVKAFEDYDAGIGADLYRVAYGAAFGIEPSEVTSDQRQIGKCLELSMGYAGGVGAFTNMARVYGLDFDELVRVGADSIPKWLLNKSASWYDTLEDDRKMVDVLTREQWVTCDAIKALWRDAHPNTVQIWAEFDQAVRKALTHPDKDFPVGGHLSVRRRKNWIDVRLPSGRTLCYASVRAEDSGLTYMSADALSGKWQRLNNHGGRFFQQACQAIARDVLACGMVAAEKAGYEIVLTVHDEIVAETPETDDFNADGLSSIMATVPPWAQGLPLSAEGFEAKRYRK